MKITVLNKSITKGEPKKGEDVEFTVASDTVHRGKVVSEGQEQVVVELRND